MSSYVTLAEFKAAARTLGSTTDAEIDRNLETASRDIDDITGRRFYSTSVDETRYFTAVKAGRLLLPTDLLTLTTLATDDDGDRTYENTWASTDYDLYPYNAALDGEPYWAIDVTPDGDYTFPVGVAKGVKLVGKFGYCTLVNVPVKIKSACIIRAAMLMGVTLAPFGMAGLSETDAVQVNANPYGVYRGLLETFRRLEVG